jgi:hypothetical protein
MSEFTYEPSKHVSFRDKEVLERVRKIKREDLEKHVNPDCRIHVIPDADMGIIMLFDIFHRIKTTSDYNDPLSVMIKLSETYPDTMIWGSDTPAYYWIQKYYTGKGELIEDRLDCGYKEETQLFHNLPDDIKTQIAYKNNMRFIFGEEK